MGRGECEEGSSYNIGLCVHVGRGDQEHSPVISPPTFSVCRVSTQ